MGFLFGFIIGVSVAGGGVPQLGSIPLRCIAAFGASEQEYRDCRTISLSQELMPGCKHYARQADDGPCSLSRHFAWEISALRELETLAQKQAKKN